MNDKRTRHVWPRAAGCVAALSMLAGLAACGAPARQGRQAVVTSDSLAPGMAVQEVVEQLDADGKQYDYAWDAEDVAGSTEKMRKYMERERERALAQDPAAAVRTDEEIEAMLLKYQEMWNRQREKEYVVGAQEAANIAGTAMEELYGLDLSQTRLQLRVAYLGGSAEPIMREEVWGVEKPRLEKGGNYIFIAVSTTTGQIMEAMYGPSEQEQSAMQETAVPACMQLWEGDGLARYLFDPADPSYPALENKMKKQVADVLSGSRLTGGARATHVIPSLETQPPAAEKANEISSFFKVYCDNGRTLHVFWYYPYPNYGFSGYPLRAFSVSDRTEA